jgi:hypothetical protein
MSLHGVGVDGEVIHDVVVYNVDVHNVPVVTNIEIRETDFF